MIRCRIALVSTARAGFLGIGGVASPLDGLCPSTAAISAQQLQADYPASVTGAHCFDPDGPGSNAPSRTIGDRAIIGGGWLQAAGRDAGPFASVSALTLALTPRDVVDDPFDASGPFWSVDVSALVQDRGAANW